LVGKPPLDFVLIAPHGANAHRAGQLHPTPAYGEGLRLAGLEPDYWEGGEHQFYDGPPPRCASMVTDELIPYVEKYFPAIAGREGSRDDGISYGGIAPATSACAGRSVLDPAPDLRDGAACRPRAPSIRAARGRVADRIPAALGGPGIQPLIESAINPPLIYISQNGDGLGTDYAYTRQHHPPDLNGDARAFRDGSR